MKLVRFSTLLFLLLLPFTLFGQEVFLSNGFIFPDFKMGTVVFNNGSLVAAPLNYNCFKNEMIFKNQDSTVMTLADPSAIKVIKIGERFFVYSGLGAFYEEIQAGDTFFYIQWRQQQFEDGKLVDNGGYSGASALSGGLANVGVINGQGAGNYANLRLDMKYDVKDDNLYFIKVKERYRSFNSAKTLSKFFKGHELEIDAFAKEQNINFIKPADIGKIVEFCSKLAKK